MYKINVLNQLVDRFGKIILDNCPQGLIKLIEDYENDISELKRENEELEKEVKNKEIEVKDLEYKISQLENELESCDFEEIEELKEEIIILKCEVMDLENELSEFEEIEEKELESFGKLIHKNTRHLAIEYYYDTDNSMDIDVRIMNMKYEDVLSK